MKRNIILKGTNANSLLGVITAPHGPVKVSPKELAMIECAANAKGQSVEEFCEEARKRGAYEYRARRESHHQVSKRAMNCGALGCTGKHSGKWRIGELCPLAREKRRASWCAYDQRLYEAHSAAYVARFGSLSSTRVIDATARLDMRMFRRQCYKSQWALRKRIGGGEQRLAELFGEA